MNNVPFMHAPPRWSGLLICKFIAINWQSRSCMDLTTVAYPTIRGKVQLVRVCFIVLHGQTKLGLCYTRLDMLSLIPSLLDQCLSFTGAAELTLTF